MIRLHIPPPVVDQMSLFQCAVLLGVDEKPEPAEGEETFMGRPVTPADKERLERYRAGPSEDTDITAQVMREMGMRTN